jgi:acyl carrier protein phosphodiesterase
MNFLAHLLLTQSNQDMMLGNYLADFLKNQHLNSLPTAVVKGIMLHRRMDSYTDQHPLVLQGARRLYEKHHKYAPVLMDIYYDFLLVQNWSTYASVPLTTFVESVYVVLNQHMHTFPPPVDERTAYLIQHNWLMSYTTLEGLASTFERMKYRTSQPTLLDNGVSSLKEHYELLNEEFNLFFPETVLWVAQEMESVSQELLLE